MATPQALLTRDRLLYWRECDGRAEVHQVVARTVAGGGHDATPKLLGEYACRATPIRHPRARNMGGLPQIEADWRIYLAADDHDLAPREYQVIKGNTITIGSDRYQVIHTDTGNSEGICLTCDCLKLA
jgi:hypothetical protein